MSAATAGPAGDQPGRGILLMLIAVACFVVMDALIKWLSATFPTMQVVFFRSLFALVPIAAMVAHQGGIERLKTKRPGMHALRCAVGLGSMICFFHAFRVMPLADVIAIGFAAPLFVTALSVPLLGEKVGIRRWTAVVVGFVGVLVMVRPGLDLFEVGAGIALLGTVAYSLAMILMRDLGKTDTTTAITFYFTMSATIVAGLAMPFVWVEPRDLSDWLLLALVGLIGGVAQLLMTQAFRITPVAVIAPFDYTAMLWGSILGYAVWGEVPDAPLWVGAAIVAGSGLYIVHRETRLRVPRLNIGTRSPPRR
ncbi:DMT family transporter [Stella sp.]|uniref:DMT family transporter n=1 Tax=Stella sp. TaxID=2912054 RepID=UPI0035B2A2CD